MNKDVLGVSPQEFFRQIGVSRALGYKLIKNGTIPAIRISERRLIVPMSAFEKLLETGQRAINE